MKDFAAAAMMRLIQLGLKRQGLTPPATDAPSAAHVALREKRTLARTLLETHGPAVLLRIGEAVRDAPEEPAMVALGLARDPADLISRWQRLERFVHSRHRTQVLEQDATRLVLRHVALKPHPPPQPAEDLLVFGLLIALIDYVGADDVRARLAGDTAWRLRQGSWTDVAFPNDVSCWELAWTPARQPAATPASPAAGADWATAARERIAADPGRGWALGDLADSFGVSARSLQRRLGEERTSFSRLLSEARLAAASTLLGTSDRSAAEIGYACGFSDQAHFTRAFKRHTALTPSTFRAQFALGR